ncbi:MAG TPA: hypothetical protein VLN59_09285, partial [Burkholderiales bacterium]|nr:hypothetical protein [Burkholderiales bacterium]
DASQTPDLTATNLTKVEACAASVDPSGALLLPARVLSPSAVSLWVVKSGGGAGLSTCSP